MIVFSDYPFYGGVSLNGCAPTRPLDSRCLTVLGLLDLVASGFLPISLILIVRSSRNLILQLFPIRLVVSEVHL